MGNQKQKFAERLNEALDDMNYPRLGHGRQSALAKELRLPLQSVTKWLKGEDYPKTSELVKLSQFANVRSNWLLSGVGSKYQTTNVNQSSDRDESSESGDNNSKPTGPRLDKDAFNMALAFMKLPEPQRVVIRKLVEVLAAEQDQ